MSSSLPFRPIIQSPAFTRYSEELLAWLAGESNEDALYHTGAEVCRSVRASGLQPEHLLIALHAAGLGPHTVLSPGAAELRGRRYTSAVHLLLRACFGAEAPIRVVRGSDGREWSVMGIREGERWDPEIEMRRRDWLCCVTTDDRRYISPVPLGWEQWTDEELAAAVMKAKPDLRGPR
jgi:hypothetical protein